MKEKKNEQVKETNKNTKQGKEARNF